MNQPSNVPVGAAGGAPNTAPTRNIIDTLKAAGHFATLVNAISAAGLTDALTAKGPFTVFAPTEEAFKKLGGGYGTLLKDTGRLKAILNYHVVSGHLAARDLKSGDRLTLQGSPLSVVVSSSDIRVNGTPVTKAELVATNGIVHAIDKVILPKNWQLLAAAA